MSLHNAPLTPPLTENDAQHLASQSQASSAQGAQRTGHAPTVYQDIFPRLSNLAIQNHLADLVALAEEADIIVCGRLMSQCKLNAHDVSCSGRF